MAFTYTPQTAEQMRDEEAKRKLFEVGTYDFEVFKACIHTSKRTGVDMLKVTLKVFGPGGRSILVDDYLAGSAPGKLRKFSETTGTIAEYEAGTLCPEILANRGGKVKLAIEQQDGFAPRNKVSYYVAEKAKSDTRPQAPASTPAPKVTKTAQTPEDDDVPF